MNLTWATMGKRRHAYRIMMGKCTLGRPKMTRK
jgi:hypothetical protein